MIIEAADIKTSGNDLRLEKLMENSIQAMATLVEKRDYYTSCHQSRVARLAGAIAAEMGLPGDMITGLDLASRIHDIGKIVIPFEILCKPGKLSEVEFNVVKQHPQVAHDILAHMQFYWPVVQIILQHHERLNGSGYPAGLQGEAILPEASILAVADVVEAISFDRPYRPAPGLSMALCEISMERGILYDAEAVDACFRLFSEKGFSLS
jgi:HD-GYP domain-containing protein (c-di-GMP phosphodiesterase class II)